jgi:LacI family transcriptional regulator
MSRRRKGKVTIRDVAEELGVHHSTVSRALSPDKRSKISPEVVKKVETTAKRLGYFPNLVASSLKQNRSFAIGVLVPDLTNPLFPPIIRGIQDTAEAVGFTVIIANTDDDEDKAFEATQIMQSRSIEGVIIATARRDDPTVEHCIQNDIHFVLVNRTVDRDDVNAIILDEDRGIRLILDHLIELGHTRIAHVAGPQNASTGYARARAFTDYLRIRELRPDLIEIADRYTVEEGRLAFRKLQASQKNFTAVVAGNDLLALGCIDAIHESGLSVPADFSIAGYNDMMFLDRMSPALTTVSVPTYEMGARATNMLLESMDGTSKTPIVLKIQPRLIVRDSTAAATD